ncbi:MAG: alpha/beta fold hydrolase [Planctomycetaceae bacterium]|nr:alpha/beta fold hydrolase [Planctomycetaceae bacterium]
MPASPAQSTILPWAARRLVLIALLLLLAGLVTGCAQERYISRRSQPNNPLTAPLRLLSRAGPRPTPRTQQLLRSYDLESEQKENPQAALAHLQAQIALEPTPEKLCSYAELAYIQGKRLEASGNRKAALDLYGASVAHAYWYLLDPNLDLFRNPYDPQFRRACDLYNESLESAMRIVQKAGRLKPGEAQVIQTGTQQYVVDMRLSGPWRPEDLEKLEFVSDFELGGGLTNRHHTYGLGVPLIAVRRRREGESPAEKYYPPGLSFPVTAFLHVEHQTPDEAASGVHHCVLELFDPMYASNIEVASRLVPLETDLTTPLAYFLDHPAFRENDIATFGLLNPGKVQGIKGLYMVEPFDPNRIPVVMVHGLWSSPTAWMEMFNDLRAFPEIRSRYQFWFFLYPTGQPFWTSAAQLRDTLVEARTVLDPQGQNPQLNELVLVGHSMGGLVSRLQTIESGDSFWRLVSDKPLEELKATPAEQNKLAKSFYFHPNPAVKRVVTIGTPHHGSTYSNDYTQYLGRSLITLPEMMVEMSNKLIRENPGAFRNTDLLTTTTSIDSLSPKCPIFPVLNSSPRAEWTQYHNVIGVVPKKTWLGSVSEVGDGVVGQESARWEAAASEVAVPADHLVLQQHPLAILEVRRILLEHAASIDSVAAGPQESAPAEMR